jgi:hypothetical protein
MTIMTNFRAQDMPGNQKPATPVAPAKKVAAKKVVEAPVETPVEDTVVETEEAPAE